MNRQSRRQLFTGVFAPAATRHRAPVALAVLLLSLPLPAQQPDAAAKQQMIQEKVAALKESLAQNQAALKQYSWTESTEISLKGEVKKREQKECTEVLVYSAIYFAGRGGLFITPRCGSANAPPLPLVLSIPLCLPE